jgi:hypothetical protein
MYHRSPTNTNDYHSKTFSRNVNTCKTIVLLLCTSSNSIHLCINFVRTVRPGPHFDLATAKMSAAWSRRERPTSSAFMVRGLIQPGFCARGLTLEFIYIQIAEGRRKARRRSGCAKLARPKAKTIGSAANFGTCADSKMAGLGRGRGKGESAFHCL